MTKPRPRGVTGSAGAGTAVIAVPRCGRGASASTAGRSPTCRARGCARLRATGCGGARDPDSTPHLAEELGIEPACLVAVDQEDGLELRAVAAFADMRLDRIEAARAA